MSLMYRQKQSPPRTTHHAHSCYGARGSALVCPCALGKFMHTEWVPRLNAFATGNPFWGTKLLGITIGRGLGALKRLRAPLGIRAIGT